MLPAKELDKLGPGWVVKARLYNSAKTNATEPHYCVILNPDASKAGRFHIVGISRNRAIDSTFIMPVPAHTGLDGFIVGSWLDYVDEPGITWIGTQLLPTDMIKVHALISSAAATKSGKPTTPS